MSRIATAWVEEYPSNGIKDSMAFKTCALKDYPGTGSSAWDEIDLIKPVAGGQYRLYSTMDVQWTVGTSATGNRAVLTFGTNGSSSAGDKLVDTVATDHVGLYHYTWTVGKYIVDASPPERTIDPGNYDNCYFRARLINSSGSPIASDIEGKFSIYYGVYLTIKPSKFRSFASFLSLGENDDSLVTAEPGDTIAVACVAQSVTGLDSLFMEYSTNNGQTWDTTGCVSNSFDSTVLDTIYTTDDTLYTYEYCDTMLWILPNEPTSACMIRVIAADTNTQVDTVTAEVSFAISLGDVDTSCTRFNQGLIDVGRRSDLIGMVYQGEIESTPIIYYTESQKGWALDTPDSLGVGIEPLQSEGCVVWVSQLHDTIYCSSWDEATSHFPSPSTVRDVVQGAIATQYATPDLMLLDDTVHMVTISKIVRDMGLGIYRTDFYLEHLKFPKDQPYQISKDSISLGQTSGYDFTTPGTISMDIQDTSLLIAFSGHDTCFYLKIPINPSLISPSDIRMIGTGFCPEVAANDGNITYSYVSRDSSSLVRLWGYKDDTIWVERDTISLDYDGSCLAAAEGLLYGVQQADTALSHQYIYDPLSEQLLLEETYAGYYSHPFLDTDSSFNRVTAYTWNYDSAAYCFMTDRTFLNGILPELYIESDDRCSPYTVYRDDCIHYASVDVDSGIDNLEYLFPDLDEDKDYALLVEFYTECDSSTTLEIQVGTSFDTLEIPGGGEFSWYETNIPSGTDTLELAVRLMGANGFVPVSRVIVRRRTDAGMYTLGMAGPPLLKPQPIPFCLYQPYPNPFTNAATIRYSLPYTTNVSLKIYDVSGRLVSKLVDGEVIPGVHTVNWTGKDDVNRRCAAGVYFVRFTAGDYQASKKMVLIK